MKTMGLRTIRTTQLLARGGTPEAPYESQEHIAPALADAEEERPAELATEDDAPETTVNVAQLRRRGRPPKPRPPEVQAETEAPAAPASPAPASPRSAAAKGRRGRKPRVVSSPEVTAEEYAAYGKLSINAHRQGVPIETLVDEARAIVAVYEKVRSIL
jgi:hypothetical protein